MIKKNNKKEQKLNKVSFSNFIFKVVVILGIFLLFFIFYKLSGQIYKQKKINQEIVVLQEEISRLNQDNNNLKEMIDYFQTDQYKEKETRDKLGLIKEGEEVIEVREKEVLVKSQTKEEAPQIEVNHPNYYYWWYYFFGIS